MPWINSSADIKGIAYNVGQRIDTLTGTCYSNVTGTSSGYTFEQLSSMYGYTYYYGGIWQAPGGEAVVAPYGVRIGSGGSILFSASADNFPSALYAINYNGNGGSDMSAWTQTKRWGEAMALTTEVPKRTGHIFSNWQDRAPGQAGATGYAPGAVYDRNESVTMYAMWGIDTYTVSYNANGGSGAPGNQTKTFGQTLILSASRPVRVGYNFMGWSTAPSGGVNYHPGGNYTANTPITLYAVWSLITYSITYNANGGSGAPTNQIKYYEQALTISGTHPVRTGHKFIGWSTSAGGGVVYHPGANYTANASAILYAVWQINTWNISYNANGGSGAPGSQTKTYGQTLTLSSTRPTRTGYTFKGWATSAGGVVAYQPGGSYTNNVGAMLYAVWEIIVLTVSFNATANGGSVSEASRRVNYGDRVGGLPGAQRQYYKFMGWFTAAEGGSQIRSEQVITANVTYYAQYKIDASLFEYRGGRWVPMIIFEYTGGRWQKVFAFEYIGGRWKQGIGG